jgi:demethylmenaquinone methyltransferase/2-methoxy-6-polyprenyl-1,4-benzoquinol methylase
MTDSTYVKNLFASIASRYELANHLLSGGMDVWWRQCVAKKVAAWKPTSLLDLATGNGDLAFALSKKIPAAKIIGVDFCPEMLTEAKKKKSSVTFLEADGMALPFDAESFDVITISFGLRNMESFERALGEMHRVLGKEGHLLILDFSIPTSSLLRPLYRWYLHHILPRFAGWITGKADAYEYMGASIEAFPSGQGMCELLERCGFTNPIAEPLTVGIVTIYTAKKRVSRLSI